MKILENGIFFFGFCYNRKDSIRKTGNRLTRLNDRIR